MLNRTQKTIIRKEPVTPSRVAKCVELSGLTQREVAQRLDVAQSYLSEICGLNDARPRYQTITVRTARSIATFFGLTIEEVVPADVEVKNESK